jgi:short-subunit dehydrogenase
MSTVLITGANRGLGYEFVKQYSEKGFNICYCYC